MTSKDWDKRYEAKELVWSAEPNLFLPPAVEGMAAGKALDLAAGEGRNAIWLATQGWEATAVDFSAVGLEKGRALAEHNDVEVCWVCDDALSYQTDEKYDLIAVFYVHLVTDQMDAMIQNARTLLAPGGMMLGVGHALENLERGVGGPPYPEILWTFEGVEKMLKGLDAVVVEERSRDTGAGVAIDVFFSATAPE